MRHLVAEHWKAFVLPDGTFDGKHFERLVERILNVHFGGAWRLTKFSWDGGKDAVKTEERTADDGALLSVKSWAECKLYRKPLSLQVISKTLVMAVIEQPERILLFSYSPIIRNARDDLARFSAATGIIVQVIDDEALEDIVLRNLDHVRSPFFDHLPDDFTFDFTDGGLELTTRLTQDVDIDPLRLGLAEQAQPSERPIINLRSLLRLQLTICNRRAVCAANVSVTIAGAGCEGGPFELLNKDNGSSTVSIAPHGLSLFEYYLRPNEARDELCLPSLAITEPGELPIVVEPGTIGVRRLLEPPLLGSRFAEFIHAFRERVSLRARPLFSTIHGRSGVGKTRLTTELAAVLLGVGHEIHAFDGADQQSGFANFARKLCSRLYRLPDFRHVGRPARLSSAPEHETSDSSRIFTVEDILYDVSIDPSDHVEDVLRLTEHAINTRGVALLIDNVQYFDGATIRFLDGLVRRYRDTASRLVCVFTFNTDFLGLNANAVTLLEELRSACYDSPSSNLQLELRDLDKGDVDLFLNHMIAVGGGEAERSFTDRFPMLAELLREKMMWRPLNVVQTMMYLADTKALRRRDDALFVDDVGVLTAAVEKVPKDLKDLIKSRWRRILRARPELEAPAQVLSVLRTIDLQDAPRLGLRRDDWDKLVEHGIAQVTTRGELAFYHEQVERSFSEIYDRLDPSFAARIARDLAENALDDVYFPAFVIASDQGNVVDDKLVQRAAFYLRTNQSFSDLQIRLGETVRALLYQRPEALSPKDELSTLLEVCELVSARDSRYRIDVFAAEVKRRMRHLSRYRAAPEQLIALIREQASHQFALHNDADALQVLEDANRLVDELQFPTERDRALSRAGILNRLCVAQKSLAQRDDALATGFASLEIAQRSGDRRLIVLNHIDLGYIFYDSVPYSAELKHHWSHAVEAFHEDPEDIRNKTDYAMCANLIDCHLLVLERRLDEAAEVIERFGRSCMDNSDAFFGTSFILLQIVRYMLTGKVQSHLSLIQSLVDRALDACMRHGVKRHYWRALHAQAQLHLLNGDGYAAMQSYHDAFEQLVSLTTSATEPLFRYFFEDMAIASSRIEISLQDSVMTGIRNPYIKDRVRRISRFDPTELAAFLESYAPCATYSDGKTNLPCP